MIIPTRFSRFLITLDPTQVNLDKNHGTRSRFNLFERRTALFTFFAMMKILCSTLSVLLLWQQGYALDLTHEEALNTSSHLNSRPSSPGSPSVVPATGTAIDAGEVDLHATGSSDSLETAGRNLHSEQHWPEQSRVVPCFLTENTGRDDSAHRAFQTCWNILAGPSNHAGTLCLSTDSKHEDSIDITCNTTGSGWFVDQVFVWMGEHGSYPQSPGGEPLADLFPVKTGLLGRDDKPRPSLYKVSLPFGHTGFRGGGKVRNCQDQRYQTTYQLLAQIKVSDQLKSSIGYGWESDMEIKVSWATLADITLGCNCPSSLRNEARSILPTHHAKREYDAPFNQRFLVDQQSDIRG
jgi:hypothetical protein